MTKLSMKFGIDSTEKLVNHWMLNAGDQIQAIADSAQWKDGHAFEAKVTVNGVELPFEAFDKFLESMYKSVYDEAREEFKDLDRAVQDRLNKRMKAEAEPFIDKLHDLLQRMENFEDVIVPYYDRPKDNSVVPIEAKPKE